MGGNNSSLIEENNLLKKKNSSLLNLAKYGFICKLSAKVAPNSDNAKFIITGTNDENVARDNLKYLLSRSDFVSDFLNTYYMGNTYNPEDKKIVSDINNWEIKAQSAGTNNLINMAII